MTDQSRRSFMKKAATGSAVATIAPGVVLYSVANASRDPGEAVTDKVRWGMLIDASKCADGCSDCVEACRTENGVHSGEHGRADIDAQWIRKVQLRDKQTSKEYSIPLLCQHCEHPPCVDVCPTGASFKRADGIVLVDKHICIGCRYCMMACPYKARSFIHEVIEDQRAHAPRGKGTVESCTFCVHKVDAGEGTTACVEACTHDAMIFGDLNDPNSQISRQLKQYPSRLLREDLHLNQGVRYRNI